MAIDFFGNVVGGAGLSPWGWAAGGLALANTALGYSNAEQNRSLQQSMSNTAYQRSMADMRAAGLNPILGAAKGGGASTPSGAPMPGGQNPVLEAMSAKRLQAETKNIEAQTELTKNKSKMTDPVADVAQFVKGWLNNNQLNPEKLGRDLAKQFREDITGALDVIVETIQEEMGSAKKALSGDSIKKGIKDSYYKAKKGVRESFMSDRRKSMRGPVNRSE